jgi:hypothetical protein
MIDTDKYEGHDNWKGTAVNMANEANKLLIADAPLILAAYDKQVRWINDILFRLEKMEEASASQRLRFLLTVQEELEMMIE